MADHDRRVSCAHIPSSSLLMSIFIGSGDMDRGVGDPWSVLPVGHASRALARDPWHLMCTLPTPTTAHTEDPRKTQENSSCSLRPLRGALPAPADPTRRAPPCVQRFTLSQDTARPMWTRFVRGSQHPDAPSIGAISAHRYVIRTRSLMGRARLKGPWQAPPLEIFSASLTFLSSRCIVCPSSAR